MADMKIRTGWTMPIGFTIKQDGSALDVSGTTTKTGTGRLKGQTSVKFSRSLTFDSDGKVVLTPQSGDFDTRGTYELEIKLVWSDGTEYVPGLFTIEAAEALA